MSAPAPPCRGCPHRRPGCHDGKLCARWAVYQKAQAEYSQRRRAAAAREQMLSDYDKAIRQRMEARRGSHGRRK